MAGNLERPRSGWAGVLRRIGLLFHTLRYLKPIQVYWRLWLRVYYPFIENRAVPMCRPRRNEWIVLSGRAPSMTGQHHFRFLNEDGELDAGRDGWNDPRREKLWLYNLHYFDDLNADGAGERVQWHRALVQRWIDENPVGVGNGWEPYPTSLRVVNWIKWALSGHQMEPVWQESLANQVRFLRRRLEFHLLGNHLFANAKALVFAGLYFLGDEANEWLLKGLEILAREVPEQVLPDGGHFERSPMYHAVILHDLLDLLNLTRTYGLLTRGEADATHATIPTKGWSDTALGMLHWYRVMSHPDGELSFFNDATLGIAPRLRDLEIYLNGIIGERESQVLGSFIHLRESGYVRASSGKAVVLLDIGQIGPDYLPGHAHADTLSFEMSLGGQRIMVNSGISRYGQGPERLRQRGTSAHNTVVVDGEDSSEVWGGFRVARRARPTQLAIEERPSRLTVNCAHDGYRRLSGRPVHWRTWIMCEKELEVRDRVEGGFSEAVAYFHVHPNIRVIRETKKSAGQLLLNARQIACWRVSGGRVCIEEASYHPGFGIDEPMQVIKVVFEGCETVLRLEWDRP